MKAFQVFSVIAIILTIAGALNWLAVGLLGFNLVEFLSFGMGWIERLVYILVGLSGIFMIIRLAVMGAHTRTGMAH